MPKLRTSRGAAKRFARTGTGRFKCRHSHKRHILTKKSRKRKRNLCMPDMVASVDQAAVRKMMPYA
jgi:large subunit ribosomal protein L35